MTDENRLLDVIEEGVSAHGGDLGGWTRRDDDLLQLFDGRVTLRANVSEAESSREGYVHAHVLTTLHDHDDEVLDACVIGMGKDRDSALAEAAIIWITCVAGPIRSFIDGKPVCMTCQAGVQDGDTSQGYVQGDYGLTGLRAFVGPSICRGIENGQIQASLDDAKPWFRFAAESAAPRSVHLAKSTLVCKKKIEWSRELEIDGHEVSYHDPDWPAGVEGPEFGYLTRFAVFEFPRNSAVMQRRAELERAIRYFAEHFSKYESVDDLMDEMIGQGFDADLVHEVESISTIAFGRSLFEQHGVHYSTSIIRARRDDRIETGVPLMSIPAYSRARALAVKLSETMSQEDYQALCVYNAESNAILQAMEGGGDDFDLSQMTMYPSVVPERGVSDQTMQAAMETLRRLVDQQRPPSEKSEKPWWKFW